MMTSTMIVLLCYSPVLVDCELIWTEVSAGISSHPRLIPTVEPPNPAQPANLHNTVSYSGRLGDLEAWMVESQRPDQYYTGRTCVACCRPRESSS